MLDPGGSRRNRYSAFISYSRSDERAAAWLQSALEAYRVPGKLVGKPTPLGPLPRKLAPVFRDRLELAAAPDLEAALTEALGASDALIVVCSPASAQSAWVNREIEMFHALGRGNRIFAALFDGDETDAFPPAMLHGDSGERLTPLAADFRSIGDGRRLGKLKLVAVLTGVGLEALLHREQDRRIRRLTGFAGASAGLSAAFAFVAVAALNAESRAEREQAQSERMIETLIGDLRTKVKPVGNLGVLADINESALGYFRGQSLADMPDSALAKRARLLMAMGEDEMNRGNLAIARVHFEEAHRTTAKRLAADPADTQRVFDHAQSEFWVGHGAWQARDFATAQAGFDGYAKLAEQLAARDPANADWRMEAGFAVSNQGMLAMRQHGDFKSAIALYKAAVGHFEAARAQKRDDPAVAMELAVGYGLLADAHRNAGNYAVARRIRLTNEALLQKMVDAEPANQALARDLLANTIALARIDDAEGRRADVGRRLGTASSKAELLLRLDPNNNTLRSQLRLIEILTARQLVGSSQDMARAAVLLGQCTPTRKSESLAEVEDWCRLSLARLEGRHQRVARATQLVRQVRAARTGPGQPTLSIRFGLNFAAEADSVQAAINGQQG